GFIAAIAVPLLWDVKFLGYPNHSTPLLLVKGRLRNWSSCFALASVALFYLRQQGIHLGLAVSMGNDVELDVIKVAILKRSLIVCQHIAFFIKIV
ncbi:hypothetical protein, partial [Corynebacterium sp. HMSC076D02]|uniref:hypothetical protein n=1 Tax=Corynebacterium sp. HMSC076D02 TaxID=1739439 RepID=UPI001AEFA6AA